MDDLKLKLKPVVRLEILNEACAPFSLISVAYRAFRCRQRVKCGHRMHADKNPHFTKKKTKSQCVKFLTSSLASGNSSFGVPHQ